MAGHHEVFNFVNKFINLWKTGFEAKLHVESQAGQAWVQLQVGLGALQQPHYHRKPGPAQLRRRARRAEARASQVAAQAADIPPANTDEAVEASAQAEKVIHPTTAEVAVQVAVNVPSADAAVQVALLVPPIPAAQAAYPSHEGHCGDHRSVLDVDSLEAAPCAEPPKHDARVVIANIWH